MTSDQLDVNKANVEVNVQKAKNSFLSRNPLFLKLLDYLDSKYHLAQRGKLSCNDIYKILKDLSNKLERKLRHPNGEDDKYNQKGLNGFFKKLLKILQRLWNSCISVITSNAFQAIFFIYGLYSIESVFVAIFVGSFYILLCQSIKYFSGRYYGTDPQHEPSTIGIPKISRIPEYIKWVYTTVRETLTDVFNWFFFKVEDEKKDPVKRNRRFLLLALIVFCILIILF
jgi:hypothetical protein